MRIIVTTETDSFTLEVSEELELENFKVLCEAESGLKASDIVVVYNGRRLTEDKKSLKDYEIKDGELLMIISMSYFLRRAAERMQQVQQRNPTPAPAGLSVNQIDFGSIQIPGSSSGRASGPSVSRSPSASSNIITADGSSEGTPPQGASSQGQDRSQKQDRGNGGGGVEQDDLGLGDSAGSEDDPAVIRDMLLANPEQLALLKHNNPKLADALTSGDLDHFASVLREQQEARRERERQRIRLISADPFDMEAQKMIAEEIQQENINANMEAAMEFNPESFGTVHMLYINCRVNGHPVKAFIDSGAQTTIMSQACAERCNIMRLVDNRWAGIAKGVGTQRIIGRVHMGQIQIEGDFLASSFSILEEQPMDMLLGLDMLKRHQMVIDLKGNQLIIGTTNSHTKFLNESELPDCARLTALTEEEVMKQSERAAQQSEDQALAKALADSVGETSNKALKNDINSTPHRTDVGGQSNTTSTAAPIISTPPPALPPAVSFPEADISELMQIGFSREDVIKALRDQNGDKTQAIAALFAKSIRM